MDEDDSPGHRSNEKEIIEENIDLIAYYKK
jgi:hypothetical protein